MVKLIKVYDLKKMVERETSSNPAEQYTTHRTHKIAIVDGPKGSLVFDNEGVGIILQPDNTYSVYVNKKEEGKIFMMPSGSYELTTGEMQKYCKEDEVEEMEIKNFIRQFSSRIETNFGIMLKCIEEIGLDRNDYYNGGRFYHGKEVSL